MSKIFNEQSFFRLTGLVLLLACFWRLWQEDIAGASATFAMSFLCFIYSNVAKFKRFKGLGFEAELWEEKQKEAEILIARLKSLMTILVREAVLGDVMRNRFSAKDRWGDHWRLYDEVTESLSTANLDIDFNELRNRMFRVMVFDASSGLSRNLVKNFGAARLEARKKINLEFGSPIKDAKGYGKRVKALEAIPEHVKDMLRISETENLPRAILSWHSNAVESFRNDFDVEVEIDTDALQELQELQELEKMLEIGDFRVTEKLIKLANQE